MTLPDYIKEVKERLERATPGPWINRPSGVVQSQSVSKIIFWDDRPNIGDTHETIKPNYDLIAHAPEDLVKLIRIVEVMRDALEKIGHRQEPNDYHTEEKILGYLDCCEDVIKDANQTLILAREIARGEG